MHSLISSLVHSVRHSILPRLSIRFDKSPIKTFESLGFFVHTRSAYVAQTSLYGYLKTRMGTNFRNMFTDDEFVKSINFAKWRVFGACLSDLTVFVCALIAEDRRLERDETMQLARDCYAFCLRETFGDCEDQSVATELNNKFCDRVEKVIWANTAMGESAFTRSPADLVTFAPIADELKRYDTKIVSNSIRFRWRDVRNQLRNRLEPGDILADWRGGDRGGQGGQGDLAGRIQPAN